MSAHRQIRSARLRYKLWLFYTDDAVGWLLQATVFIYGMAPAGVKKIGSCSWIHTVGSSETLRHIEKAE